MIQRTFEATPFFRGLLKDEFGLKEYTAVSRGCTVYLWKHPWHRQLISTPYRDRMAIEYEGDRPEAAALEKALGVFGNAAVILKDVAACCQCTTPVPLAGEFVNSEVLLDDMTEKRFSLSARQKIRQAEQEHGLAVVPGIQGEISSFYRMYLMTRRRLGVVGYSLRSFKYLLNAPAGNVATFTCLLKGTPVGHLFCYLHGQEMISTHLAYEYHLRNLRITDLLFSKAFAWGKKEGFTVYRFGADNKEQVSLAAFKKKLGAQFRPQFDYIRGARQFNASSPSLGLAKKIIGAMPLWLYKPFSASLFRVYFS